ncbi:Arc/MetJ family transcription regulator [Rhizobium rosettiformans]|uniref:Type II toxin-antitoxin system VapB family antitoxin n=3 Tax=Rhizobium rosettiformans TaxID=1368430 RepID=A0A4S8Q1X2_9HYPH|nr:type II toxin-antitoxin system VapB family antitoxin [Rhizobium rosettiformans]MBB5274193.1 Arc/MetJ family transcription regulator [Rhizobium rosettiformans]THV38157.1 type II toxin-antitoxin system VapB family antitoxin [Rhizobium rosettiformans W3]
MRTTIRVDDELLADAKEFTGIASTSEVMKEALTALVQREAARRLIALGGSQPDLKAPPRRRWNSDGTFGQDEGTG